MNILLDTHVLLWAAGTPERISRNARALTENRDDRLFFTVAPAGFSSRRPAARRKSRSDPLDVTKSRANKKARARRAFSCDLKPLYA